MAIKNADYVVTEQLATGSVQCEIKHTPSKLTVIMFWATWVPTCHQPMGIIKHLMKDPTLKDEVKFIALSLDSEINAL